MSVLVLGAGLVSGPVFEYLHQHSIPFSVMSCLEAELQSVKGKYPQVTCYCLDVSDPQLPPLMSHHQLIVNLLPPPMLKQVAEMCVDQRCHMLCASYVPAELWNLHQRAVDAGVLLFCECGLDPGLDHMLAMKVIDEVVAKEGQVMAFTSWCGGLPAPDCKDDALQYKFSWNPKGALLASQREAGFVKDGQTEVLAPSKVLDNVYSVDMTDVLPQVQLEGYANKFYPHHLEAYGLKDIRNFFRGTLRYKGFCEAVKSLVHLGLFSQEPISDLQPDAPDITWRNLMTLLVTGSRDTDSQDFEGPLLAKLDNSQQRLTTLKSLGLLSDSTVERKGTPLDCLASHLSHTLAYGPTERDMTVLLHEIEAQMVGCVTERHRVWLVVYGQPGGHSAMAQTVGYPIGIVARMILQGDIHKRGIVLPTTPDIYQPVLASLAHLGITEKHYFIRSC